MKRLKKIGVFTLLLCFLLYVSGCIYLYVEQEDLIFHPRMLKADKVLQFSIPFEELNFRMSDGTNLNGVLFKSKSRKGLVFFLHGNTGNVLDQDAAARFYTDLGFDFFTFDYRSFGKSAGEITSEGQFYGDIEKVYSTLLQQYPEKEISIFGYSVGTGPAAVLASHHAPARLVLIAPYYNMMDMALERYKVVPSFLLKYKFETDRGVAETKSPIFIFHGLNDDVIPYDASVRLAHHFKSTDRLISLRKQDHNNLEFNLVFGIEMKNILNY